MTLKEVKRIAIDGSIATYELTVVPSNGETFTARLVTDMDGNYAQWESPVPTDFEVGSGRLWTELMMHLDTNPMVVEDVNKYYS